MLTHEGKRCPMGFAECEDACPTLMDIAGLLITSAVPKRRYALRYRHDDAISLFLRLFDAEHDGNHAELPPAVNEHPDIWIIRFGEPYDVQFAKRELHCKNVVPIEDVALYLYGCRRRAVGWEVLDARNCQRASQRHSVRRQSCRDGVRVAQEPKEEIYLAEGKNTVAEVINAFEVKRHVHYSL